MAYPGSANLNNQLKTRVLNELTSTSTANTYTQVIVPFRAKYLYSLVSPTNQIAQTAAGAVNFAVNGSTATADSFITNPAVSVTTSTGNGGSFSSLNSLTATLTFNQGDTIATIGSSMTPYSVSHILQEF